MAVRSNTLALLSRFANALGWKGLIWSANEGTSVVPPTDSSTRVPILFANNTKESATLARSKSRQGGSYSSINFVLSDVVRKRVKMIPLLVGRVHVSGRTSGACINSCIGQTNTARYVYTTQTPLTRKLYLSTQGSAVSLAQAAASKLTGVRERRVDRTRAASARLRPSRTRSPNEVDKEEVKPATTGSAIDCRPAGQSSPSARKIRSWKR